MVKALQIEDSDNVIVAIEPITKDEIITYRTKDNTLKTLTVTEDIIIYHKIALEDIDCGNVVVKYGEHIGKSIKDIPKGAHVHVHNVISEKSEVR